MGMGVREGSGGVLSPETVRAAVSDRVLPPATASRGSETEMVKAPHSAEVMHRVLPAT